MNKQYHCYIIYILCCLTLFGKSQVHDTDLELSSVSIDAKPICSESSCKCRYVAFVSTLKGEVYALNVNNFGEQIWYHDSDNPLLSSSIGNLKVNQGSLDFRLIPSLDGNLFQFDGSKIRPVPLSADSLLKSSFLLHDKSIIVGGKDVESVAHRLSDGEIAYTCSKNGCVPAPGGNLSGSGDDLIILRKETNTIRAVRLESGEERWNFSVSQYEVSLVDGGDKEEDYVTVDDDCVQVDSLQAHVSTGMLIARDVIGDVVWQQEFDSSIAAVTVLRGSSLSKLDLFDNRHFSLDRSDESFFMDDDNDSPVLFLGAYDGQWYIQESVRFARNLEAALGKLWNMPEIDWKPYVASAPSRTPWLNNDHRRHRYIEYKPSVETTSVAPLQDAYPFDNGYFLFDDDSCRPHVINTTRTSPVDAFATAVFYWREIALLSSALSLTTMVLVYAAARRTFSRHQAAPRMTSPIQTQTSTSTQYTSTDESDFTTAPGSGRRNRLSAESSGSNTSVTGEAATAAPFVSRFASDFTVLRPLGSGAFGVVVHARNTFDTRDYAVKRIALRGTRNERVMREILAISELEHPNIIRYYNSWSETPPPPSLALSGTDSPSDGFDVHSTNGSLRLSSHCERCATCDVGVNTDQSLRRLRPNDTVDIVFAGSNGAPTSVPVSTDKTTSSGAVAVSTGVSTELSASGLCRSCEQRSLETTFLYIQMQLCRDETLKDWLASHVDDRQPHVVLDWFAQIVAAVEYVHSKKLIHRDLKPSNVFFSLDGEIKIGDFGLATTTSLSSEVDAAASVVGPVGERHTGEVGTALYMSPEQMTGAYDEKVDIFALGVVLFELLYAFRTQMERVTLLRRCRDASVPEHFAADYPAESSLIRRLVDCDPTRRPFASVILDEVNQLPLLAAVVSNNKMRSRTRSHNHIE